MGRFVAGTVVVTRFPFSSLRAVKRRPALVLAVVDFGDLVLCQITSRSYSSSTAIPLTVSGFRSGQLPMDSYIRPDKLFTAEPTLIERTAGTLQPELLGEVLAQVRSLFADEESEAAA